MAKAFLACGSFERAGGARRPVAAFEHLQFLAAFGVRAEDRDRLASHWQSEKDAIGEIRELGFLFALDDFGVGMSSFAYLKAIPVDVLKIDGGFVRNMLNDAMDQAIVEACNKIAHSAGLITVAEFVENREIEACLRAIGVDFGQGYGIEKPRPIET